MEAQMSFIFQAGINNVSWNIYLHLSWEIINESWKSL